MYRSCHRYKGHSYYHTSLGIVILSKGNDLLQVKLY